MTSSEPAVLVTGASGFIGEHLVRLLSTLETRTIVALHSPKRPLGISPRGNLIALSAPPEDVCRVLTAPGLPDRYEALFHLGAYTPKASGEEDESAVIASNVIALRELLVTCEGRVDNLLFASTLDVYGAPTESLSETSRLAPRTLYAASKILGEVAVRRWGERTGAHTAILRVGHTYGPGEDGYRKLIPNTIRALLSGNAAVQYGDGSERRDFLYVEDAARAFVEAWRSMAGKSLETLNLVSGQSTSVSAVIRLIASIIGSQARIEHRERSTPPTHFDFDSRRLDELLPFPRTPLESGLESEVEWFRSRSTAP